MKFRLNKVMRLAALSAATTLGLAGQTHAALYQGTWDPLFGAQFPGLGWKATGTLNVSSECEDALQAYGGGGAVSLDFAAAQAFGEGYLEGKCYGYGEGEGFEPGVRLQDISVDFYDINNPSEILRTLSVYTYDWGSGNIDGETQFLTSVDFYGVVPTAFQTSYSIRGLIEPPIVGRPSSAQSLSSYGSCTNNPFNGYSFSARLGSAPITSGLQYYCDADGNVVGVPTGRSSFQPSFVMKNANGFVIIQNSPSQDPGTVPEPGTLALAGLALAGAAAARRRKRS